MISYFSKIECLFHIENYNNNRNFNLKKIRFFSISNHNYLPFLNAKNSNTLWMSVMTTVSASKYGFVSISVLYFYINENYFLKKNKYLYAIKLYFTLIVSWSASFESSANIVAHWFFIVCDKYSCHFQSWRWEKVSVRFTWVTVELIGW